MRAYIATMPGWRKEVGRRVDAVITRTVPEVRKAVRRNSPFYGVDLFPALAGGKDPQARWLDIREGELDEAVLASLVRQAAARPGWMTNGVPGMPTPPRSAKARGRRRDARS